MSLGPLHAIVGAFACSTGTPAAPPFVTIGPVNHGWTPPASALRRDAEAVTRGGVQGPGATVQEAVAGSTSVREGLPVDPPARTDAQLWSVLTSSERMFFGRAESRRATYGPDGFMGLVAPQGRTLDVRA